ncbi:3-oxocholest-4-en-26-oate--CoA ligase [BD1-7 clade bacterium]|uniref:3-oxocholest-4-en-26-oate--CoA ligase n=1 Tax=BD1-7 clade bacterium TaxID=2029982 RepID=A0A5S9PQY2_9GAMM|nr:3-oxocholest-4-en-26-oate--CoA ligase [BD1-7 clade bacterium]
MEYNLADIFECAVDRYPDREYLVADGIRRTYREMDERSNQLAHYLASQGIGKDDHVGIYAYNCVEWVETLWAVFKLRAVWININYRYVNDELAYLFRNADLKAMVYQRQFGPSIAQVKDALPDLQFSLCVDDGTDVENILDSADYASAIASQSNQRAFAPRSGDDKYMIYTGGTTGMPKGVVWRHEDVFFALGGGIDLVTGEAVKHPDEVIDRGAAYQACLMPLAPLMHGASQWAVMGSAFEGRKVVMFSQFDPQLAWRNVATEGVNVFFITGDAMARPMIEAYEQQKDSIDATSLFAVSSSAVVFSSSLKDQYLSHFPNLMILDSIGASETGGTGTLAVEKGKTGMKGGPTVKPGQGTVVLDMDTLLPLTPDSDKVGMVARAGYIPQGYYKDPKKTAETFIQANDGKRYAVPGDFAQYESDGTMTMLGRGSACINSGGEKIFPEEVESAVKSHPQVYDVTVIGVPDERWGSTVCAIIQSRGTVPELASIQSHCRQFIAGYKVPRKLFLVEKIERAPSGKPDYRWAKAVTDAAFASETTPE